MEGYKQQPRPICTNLCFFFLLINTNLLTVFICTTFYSSRSFTPPLTTTTTATTTFTIPPVMTAVTKTSSIDDNPETTLDLPSEFNTFTSPHQLPFGLNSNFDSDKMYGPVGHPCAKFPTELRQYMSYNINGSCPDDELLAQKLLLKGCEPLPRRRCRSAAQPDAVDPYPLPASLWATPADSSVIWTAYRCKNYECLVNRAKNQKEYADCKDCFDLAGRESTRWAGSKGATSLDFSIDEVLAERKPGTIRIGLDLGGGVATFAVRMRERNITIITTSMNLDGPFNNFIASRGVIPLYTTISQRLPFFDNTLDIVHSMHVLSNWIPTTLMHFLFFDIYRVLRPGGLLWLDHFFCEGDQLSALLEKPLKNSW